MDTETLVIQKLKTVPKLRFNGFEDKWQKADISSISKKITDGTHDTPTTVSEGIPYLTAIHVKDGFIDFKNSYFLRQKDHDKIYKRCNPEKGDLLMVNIGSGTATSALVDVEFEFSLKNVALIKPDRSKVDPKFLSQVQRKNGLRLKHQLSSGGAQPFLSLKQIGKLKLSYPSLPEQQKIASFLSAVDKKIQQFTRKKELLETYKKGVMKQLLSQEIRFKYEDGKDFPDWEEKQYGGIYTFLSTNSFSRNDLNYEEGLVKNIHYGDIHTKFPNLFHLSKENVPFITKEKDISRIPSQNFCQEGDLVIADASEDYKDIGKTIEIIDLNGEKVLAGLHTFLARPDRNLMHTGFSGYLVQTWEFRKQVMTIAQGTKVLGLSTGRMKKLKLEIPSISEQKKIADFLSTIDKKIEAVSQQIEKIQSFKKGLLQQMFI